MESIGGQSGRKEATKTNPRRQGFKRPKESHPGSVRRGRSYAALDLGTNNCRLLIAEPLDRGFRVVDAFSRIVRLGEGVSRTGRISDAAISRTIDALRICARKMDSNRVVRAKMIATEACRVADNGAGFLNRVAEETGLELEIVDAETEARLAVSGSASLIGPEAEGVIVFDIGGGSTELIWLDLNGQGRLSPLSAQKRIRAWASLPIGVVNLAERHGGVDVTHSVFQAMVAETDGHLEAFNGRRLIDDALSRDKKVHLLGTSGTVTTLAGIGLGLKRYNRERVDGVWFEREAMLSVTQDLLAMTYHQRKANGCIGPERADLVLPGCAILESICRAWPCDRLRVADRGLREGMLTTMMAEDGVWRARRSRGGRGRRQHRAPADANRS